MGRTDESHPASMVSQDTTRLLAIITETGNHQTASDYRRRVTATFGLDICIQNIVSAGLLRDENFRSKLMVCYCAV